MERMWSSGLGRWTYGLAIGAAVYQLCEFIFRRGKNINLTAQRSNSNTVWFNFQTYILLFLFWLNEDKKINLLDLRNYIWKQYELSFLCRSLVISNLHLQGQVSVWFCLSPFKWTRDGFSYLYWYLNHTILHCRPTWYLRLSRRKNIFYPHR